VILASLHLFASGTTWDTLSGCASAGIAFAIALLAHALLLVPHPAVAPHLTHVAEAALSSQCASLMFGVVLVLMLNRYPMKVPPSQQLDFFGRLNNLYQIIAHVGVALKFIGVTTEIFGALDAQHQFEFQAMNVLDYAGWIAIFSRLETVPWLPKTLANTHMATGILSLLGHTQFQGMYIQTLAIPVWDWSRAAFVMTDAVVRGYYHFYVLGNA